MDKVNIPPWSQGHKVKVTKVIAVFRRFYAFSRTPPTVLIRELYKVARLFLAREKARTCIMCYFRFVQSCFLDMNFKFFAHFASQMSWILQNCNKNGMLYVWISKFSTKKENLTFYWKLWQIFFTWVFFTDFLWRCLWSRFGPKYVIFGPLPSASTSVLLNIH